jgi:squalene-hopene/tetraprenyl-beta-curcumene cyclase
MVDTQQRLTAESLSDTSNAKAIDEAISRTQTYLVGEQYEEGYWWGELESNPTMEAEFLLLNYFLGLKDADRWRKLANHILGQQRSDGTWGQYYGAPGDLSTTVECYFALKLAGISPDQPLMTKAREFVLRKGGVPNTRVFTKIWLSLFGQWKWEGVPVMPAELILLPNWLPVNIYEFSSWARSTIVPLLILMDRKPVHEPPRWAAIPELFPDGPDGTDYSIKRPAKTIGWESFFYAADLVLRMVERLPVNPARGYAIRKAERWVLDHQEADGSWGGIQPPWVYSIMALATLGYELDHPVLKKAIEGFEGFMIEEGDTLRVQACVSPVWDTGLAMMALLDSDVPGDDPDVVRAGEWLMRQQVVRGGDWQVKAGNVPPGGWAFEFENDSYPDVDDAAVIATVLHRTKLPDEERKRVALDRCVRWIEGMQSSNGGWASFDKDNTRTFIARIPFSDFGETIDPPSVDVTAHVLELLGTLGKGVEDEHVERGLAYVLNDREEDGSWFGRWGVNYVYGTGSVVPALRAIGIGPDDENVTLAAQWMVDHQNGDGGWGESPASYVDPAQRGSGPSTASQTAWALVTLLAADEGDNPATVRGVNYLLSTQRADGAWDEPHFTGTGFPGYGVGQRMERLPVEGEAGFQGRELPAGFMINYHMYRIYWPLAALGRYRRWRRDRPSKR